MTKELEDMDTTRTNLLLTTVLALTIQPPYVQAFLADEDRSLHCERYLLTA